MAPFLTGAKLEISLRKSLLFAMQVRLQVKLSDVYNSDNKGINRILSSRRPHASLKFPSRFEGDFKATE